MEEKKKNEGNEGKTKELEAEAKKLDKKRFRLVATRATQEAAAQTYQDDQEAAEKELSEIKDHQKEIASKDEHLLALIERAEEGRRAPKFQCQP